VQIRKIQQEAQGSRQERAQEQVPPSGEGIRPSARTEDAGLLTCLFFANASPPRPLCAALRPTAAARSFWLWVAVLLVVFALLLSNDKGFPLAVLCAVNLSTTSKIQDSVKACRQALKILQEEDYRQP